MKEKPILFSTPMVQAILEGRKTQTRRIIKPQYEIMYIEGPFAFGLSNGDMIEKVISIPYIPGNHLWVRETWRPQLDWPYPYGKITYKADDKIDPEPNTNKWKPSIYMPRDASRITLEITDIKVERLQDITEEDAKKEGVHSIILFKGLWCKIHGDGAWDANPFVWVIQFKRI